MESLRIHFFISFAPLLLMFFVVSNAQPLVPALFIFGDSVVDVGNNNQLVTPLKANFPPYGRDFINHEPTGRFCNGKLATDFTADTLGFSSYPLAYLSKKATGENLLTGVNFASAGSGYHETTSRLSGTISLSKQLEYYGDYQKKLVELAGTANASSIISDGIHLLSTGSSDFVENYFANPLRFATYTVSQFSDVLLSSYDNFVQSLYAMGARRIGVTSLPPLGCLPAAITVFGLGSKRCVARLNNAAVSFNEKLNSTSQSLKSRLPGLKLVVFDTYQPLYNLVSNPTEYGFTEARKACCGTGLLETSVLCNSISIGTCKNASEYVFWDSLHPSEAANEILANQLLSSGISLVF